MVSIENGVTINEFYVRWVMFVYINNTYGNLNVQTCFDWSCCGTIRNVSNYKNILTES